jgi:small subunit ribosomal protein S14
MAKLSVIVRDRKRRKLVEKYAQKREELKKAGDYKALDKLPKNSSAVRLRNRCAITGRPKGYLRKFGVCRIIFRDLAMAGKVPGIKKSSW